jgi:putative DNA primase/helicase
MATNVRERTREIVRHFKGHVFYVDRYPRGYLFGFDEAKGIWREVQGEVEKLLREKLPPKLLHMGFIREVMADLCQSLYRPNAPEEPPWNLINFTNGVWDIKADKFIKNQRSLLEPPFFLSCIPHKFDPSNGSDPGRIDKVFEDWVASDYKILLYEVAGYILLRCHFAKKFFIPYGPGDNGKTTYAELLRRFVGRENCSALSMDEIMSDRFALSSLRGKLINISGELVPTLKRTDRIKLLTGGDEIFAQEKFNKGFFFKPYAKLLFMGNTIPSTPDSTDAFYIRPIIIPFPNVIPPEKKNPKLIDEITGKELQGLLTKVILEMLPAFIERDFRFSVDPSVDELRNQWESLSNPVQTFLKEHLSPSEGEEFVPNFVLHKCYRAYCEVNGLRQLNDREFADCMKKEGHKPETKRLSPEKIEDYKKAGFPITSPASPCRGWQVHGFAWREVWYDML